MSDLKLAIILGSTRPGRNGKAVADWVLAKAKERTSADYELIDLIDYPLPHLDEPVPPARGAYAGEHALARGDVDELSAYASRAPGMPYAHPTPDHYIPLFVTLGASGTPDRPVKTAIEGYQIGLAKRSFQTQ